MTEHRNTTATVRMVLKACEAQGVEADQLLAQSGIERSVAEDPDGEVSFEQMRNFWQNAYEMSNDPCLAMRAGQHVETGTYQCFDYLMVNANSIREGVENFCRYTALINTWIAWDISESTEIVTVTILPAAGFLPPPTPEFVFTIFVRRIRQMLADENWSPLQVTFSKVAPPDTSPHLDFYNCPIEYESNSDSLVIDRASWERDVPSADTGLMKVLYEHAQLLLSQRPMPDDFIGKVRTEIMHELHGGEAKRDDIAGRLCMSGRTLQRRLDEYGIGFSDLVDEVRQDLAQQHLKSSNMTLSEIGFLLGFSEQSAFSRAFKRWTGQTPKEYRKSL